jgi:hypothetical protein
MIYAHDISDLKISLVKDMRETDTCVNDITIINKVWYRVNQRGFLDKFNYKAFQWCGLDRQNNQSCWQRRSRYCAGSANSWTPRVVRLSRDGI